MTVRTLAALAALFLSPQLATAQDVPTAPVPQIVFEAPTAVQPELPQAPTVELPEAPARAPSQEPASPAGSIAPATANDGPAAAAVEDAANPDPADAQSPAAQIDTQEDLIQMAGDASAKAMDFLRNGGPSIWAIAALSVITLALILWKIWRLALIGAWSRGKAGRAVSAFEIGNRDAAVAFVKGRIGIRSKVVAAALQALETLPEDRAREETARVAKLHLARANIGLGALELIATIAPLLGLLGTVLGMIAAFQALQAAGSKADPALLAGGIWEALLTTAAGMAVAIPASAALTWFEAVIGRIRGDIEDSATRIFVASGTEQPPLAAE